MLISPTIYVNDDEGGSKNWWNIYIDPDVTNIDAILIADWSIISYDWSNVLNVNEDSFDWLRKQLFPFFVMITNSPKKSYDFSVNSISRINFLKTIFW